MRKIFGFVEHISYRDNECVVRLCEHPRKKPVKFHVYALNARWLHRCGVQRKNQPFVIFEYFKDNKMIQEIKPLRHKDDCVRTDTFKDDPETRKKLDNLIENCEIFEKNAFSV